MVARPGCSRPGSLIGGLLGPLAGGFLTAYSLRLPFYVYAVSLLVAGAIGAVFLQAAHLRPATAPVETGTPEAVVTRLRDVWKHRGYQAAVTVNFAIGWSFFGIRASLVPLYVLDVLHRSAVWIGVGFLCTSVAQASLLLVAGRFVDRRGRRPAMLAGTSVSALALAALAIGRGLPLFLVAMAILGVGGALVSTGPGAVVGDVLRGRGGKVVAVFQMSSDLGAITGPIVAGLLADAVSFEASFLACVVVMLVGTAMALRMPETLVEDAHPARSDQQADDDQNDTPKELGAHDRHDAGNDKNHRDDPEDKVHVTPPSGGPVPPEA